MVGTLSAASITSHRIVWAFLTLVLIGVVVPGLRRNLLRRHAGKTIAVHAVAAVMLSINWLTFLYAVNSDQVLQASLGYYINPLVNVLLGVVVLGEQLRPSQKIAVLLAGIGVTVMAVAGGGMPWISLAMAISFGIYGLMKKKAKLGPLEGLTIETGLLLPFALTYMIATAQDTSVAPWSTTTWTLLIIGGAVTVTPLSLFAAAATRVSLSVIGILQYIGPTIQWIVGVVVLGETVGTARFVGFVFVWCGVLVFIGGQRFVDWLKPD